MPTKLTERFVRDLSLGSGAVRDTEVRGLMVIANRRSKSYAVQGTSGGTRGSSSPCAPP